MARPECVDQEWVDEAAVCRMRVAAMQLSPRHCLDHARMVYQKLPPTMRFTDGWLVAFLVETEPSRFVVEPKTGKHAASSPVGKM